MNENRIHRATSDDGTEIVGTFQGDGPPLVLVHGAMDDGTLQWEPAVPLPVRPLHLPCGERAQPRTLRP